VGVVDCDPKLSASIAHLERDQTISAPQSRVVNSLSQRCRRDTSSGSIGRSRIFLPTSQVAGSRLRGVECIIMPRRFAAFLLFTLTLTFAGSGARAALTSPTPLGSKATLPSVQSIFVWHRKAMGRLPSLIASWSGAIDDNGQIAKYEIVAARDGRYRRTYILPLTQLSDGSNLVQDWTQDENGNVATTPAQHHEPMDSRLVRLNDLRFESSGAAVNGMTTIDGHQAYAVAITMQGSSAVVYFDTETFLLDGADLGLESIRYRAYHRFEGVAVPTDIVVSAPNESLNITVGSVSFVRESRGEFDPPAQRRPVFPQGTTQVNIAFDSPNGLIVCPVLIDGHPMRFIVDTGSTTSIIDADAAKKLNLTTGGVSHVEGAALMTGSVARVDTLSIGGVVFSPFYVQAVPLRLPSRLAHEGIDGVLGYDLLCTLVARISYSRFELELIQAGTFTYNGTGSILTIDTSKRVPLLFTMIGEKDQGTFTIDTGSSATLVLYPDYADAHRNDFENPYESNSNFASGAGGDMPTRLYLITRLQLGSFDIGDVPTEVLVREEGAFGQTSSDGLIGSGALSQFAAVFFDYGNNRMILEK
jgi:predicted aspartyl protease